MLSGTDAALNVGTLGDEMLTGAGGVLIDGALTTGRVAESVPKESTLGDGVFRLTEGVLIEGAESVGVLREGALRVDRLTVGALVDGIVGDGGVKVGTLTDVEGTLTEGNGALIDAIDVGADGGLTDTDDADGALKDGI